MKISNKKGTLLIEGMTCSNCAAGIEKHLSSRGVSNVSVNFSTSEANFSCVNFSELEIKKMIESLGYSIKENSKKEKTSIQSKLFYFSLFFTLPLFSHMFLKEVEEVNFLQDPFIQFLLCLPVYLLGTWFFGRSAIASIKSKSLNMDVLITIGSSAAFFYSIYGWILFGGTPEAHQYLFFETSATIITLVLLGNLLEKRSVQQTTTAINELSEIQKTKAKVQRNNEIIELHFEEIIVGDIIIVNSGDKIAVDGIIIEGNASIDESMITGESIPVTKTINNNVIGGTILLSGNIKIKAISVGSDTLLSNIIDLVKNAQNNKPKIQKLGDKVSGVFVPVVVLISCLTFIFSYYAFGIELVESFERSIAVLVISCPCAMGLATPTAIMVGIGRAAKNGILIKGGSTLEKFSKIKHMFFDKTGTITTGNFKIKTLEVINEEESYVKNIIFNLENYSSHPIAKSLVAELKSCCDKLEMTNVHEEKGISIEGDYNGSTYKIGSYKILEKERNTHDLFVLKNNVLIAIIDIEDEIKENVSEVITEINSFGIQTSLLSGDNRKKCENISSKISFHSIYSDQLPDEKLKIIKKHSSLEYTAMIGDGINDAPSLSLASVGISVGGSTGVANQSSEMVLLNENNLEQLITAFKISKHTYLTIKQNLFWAFSYNIVAIPVAAMGYLNPMWGALFMAFSDIIVIGNSIRLKYKKLD